MLSRQGDQVLAGVLASLLRSSAARAAHRWQASSHICFGPVTPGPSPLSALFVRRGFCMGATAAPHDSRHAPRRTVETLQDGLARNRCGSWLASDAPRGRRSISRAMQKHRQAPGSPHPTLRQTPGRLYPIILKNLSSASAPLKPPPHCAAQNYPPAPTATSANKTAHSPHRSVTPPA